MYLCYVDESGCTGQLPVNHSSIQPVFLLSGIIIHQSCLNDFTSEFLTIKSKYFPHFVKKRMSYLSTIMDEVKGSDLRKNTTKSSRNVRRHAFGFLDKYFDLLEKYNIKIISKIYIKEPGVPTRTNAIYTGALQSVFTHFQAFLNNQNSNGLVIADARNHSLNVNAAHSIFTQKYKCAGDEYPNIIEMPTFGHSDNHSGIQCTDILCSAVLFPIAVHVYCEGNIRNSHIKPDYIRIKDRYNQRLRAMQFRYNVVNSGKVIWRGGITVSDPINRQSSSLLFS